MEGSTIAKNTAFLYVRMFFVLVVSLFTARLVLNALGVNDYGVYNVVAGFVSLFGFIESTLSASIQRFFNYEGTRNGEEGFRSVYTCGLIIQFFISIILAILLLSGGLWYVNNILVVPEGRLGAARVMFFCSSASLILMMVQIPFNGAVLAREKMDFYALVSIVEVTLKLGIALSLKNSPHDRLVQYGLLLTSVTAITTLMLVLFCKSRFKDMRFIWKGETGLLKSILSFSGWSMAGTFAFLLKGQGVNMLLNSFFGPAINAARGVAYQINGAISGFSANISVAFRPQLVNSYAIEDMARTKKLMFSESKICFALIALLITPVIFEMDYILHLWLGAVVPEQTGIFAIWVLLDALICTLNTPCTQIVYAVGNIKKYQIFSTVINLCLIPACFAFLKAGYPARSVFIITFVFSCINQAVCLILTRQQFHFEWKEYFRDVLLPGLETVILLPLLPALIITVMEPSFLRLMLVCMAALLTALPAFYYLVLNEEERRKVMNSVKSKLSR